MTDPQLILASTSVTRIQLLASAGVQFKSLPACVDEAELHAKFVALPAETLALELARAKARSLSTNHPEAIVIGADQTLQCAGVIFHKAQSLEGAKSKLKQLRGRAHQLHSAVACVQRGEVVYENVATATLTMRNFSDAFLDRYLKSAKDEALSAVGCYFYEGQGIQLFQKIEGDYHTILGLPLLPLLAFLRQSTIIQA